MINDPGMGTLVVASAGADAQAQQVISQRDRTDKGVVFLWTGSRDAKAGLAQLKHARIPIFYTPDKLARGLQSRLKYHTWASVVWPMALARPRRTRRRRMRPSPRRLAWGVRHSRSPRASSCWRPGAWGVGSARKHRANSAEAAVAAAEQLGFPVALKLDSPDLPHKIEAGVVRLNLADMAQVRTAYAEILASAKAYLTALPLDGGAPGRPPARAGVPKVGGGDRAGGNQSTPSPLMGEGRGGGEFAAADSITPQTRIIVASVQEMVREGVEVIIGVSCDPQLGPVLLFGSGGVIVEVYNDVALRRCPPSAQKRRR